MIRFYSAILAYSLFALGCGTTTTTEPSNQATADSSLTTTTTAPTAEKNTYTLVRVNNLRVRSSPNKNSSDVIGMLKENTTVQLTGQISEHTDQISLRGQEYNEHWYEIETNCLKGWVYGGAIDRNVVLAQLPEVGIRQQISFPKSSDILSPNYDDSENEVPLFSPTQQQFFNELGRAFFNINTDKELDAFLPQLEVARDTFSEVINSFRDDEFAVSSEAILACFAPYFFIACEIECSGVFAGLNISYLKDVANELNGTELDELWAVGIKILGEFEDNYTLGETFLSSEVTGGAMYTSSHLGNEATMQALNKLNAIVKKELTVPNTLKKLCTRLIDHVSMADNYFESQEKVLKAVELINTIATSLDNIDQQDLNNLIKSIENIKANQPKFNTGVEIEEF